MGGDIGPSFFVAVHGENFQRQDIGRKDGDFRQTAFFQGLPLRNSQQVPLSVGVAAQPGPGVVELVKGHEDLLPVRADHPGGGGQMGGLIAAGVDIFTAPEPLEEQFFVIGFLFVERNIGIYLL